MNWKSPFFAAIAAATVVPMSPLSAENVNFENDILPVLEKKCMACHRETYTDPKRGRKKKPKGDLRMDSPENMVKAGESEKPAITAKKPDDSEALARVLLPEDSDDFMPPKGDALTKEEVNLLKKWIEEGAEFGEWKGTKFTPEGEKIEKTEEGEGTEESEESKVAEETEKPEVDK
ncbi:MAG: putative membrane protein [Verrucomicrobiales bacterium]|jgi:uncharacterized membrane protein